MKTRTGFMRRYRFFLLAAAAVAGMTLLDRQRGLSALSLTAFQLQQMVLVLPPIFLLLGLLDVWVPKTTMVKYMGEGSGLKGILLAFFIGSAAAGPLYGAFPVAAVFMKKGVKFSNLLIFIGAWSTLKIPMLLFEIESLGLLFALTRMLINIPGILLIATALTKLISPKEAGRIYENAERMEL